MSNLNELRNLRGANKGAIIIALHDIDTFILTASQADIVGKKSAVEKSLKKVVDYDEKILGLIVDDDEFELAQEADESMQYVVTIETYLAKFHEYLNDLKATSSTNIKLPQLQLKTFAGCPAKWTAFWVLCKTSVHNRKDLSEVYIN